MASSIFLIDENDQLRRLDSTPYQSETLLQELVANFPSVLAAVGEDDDLLLVTREQGVPDEEGAAARWALDHLFIDRNAVPVLVEVKRASDSRARREVVAQMLDYAANGVTYWPLTEIIETFETSCREQGEDAEQRLIAFLGEDGDPDAFWKQVEANLRSGRIRMVFLADVIAKELRRIVEFLNEQMRPAEVIAVEIAQFTTDSGLRTLVPKLVGDTERARGVKATQQALPPISVEEWLAKYAEQQSDQSYSAVKKFYAWFDGKNGRFSITQKQTGLRFEMPTEDGETITCFYAEASSGRIYVPLGSLLKRPRYAEEAARQRLIAALSGIEGITLAAQNVDGWPSFRAEALADQSTFDQFTEVAETVIGEAAKAK